MDIPQLAIDTVKFIAPYLPYLIAGGRLAAKAAIEKTGENFSDAVWNKAAELWEKLKPKVDASPSAQSAIEKAARKPEDIRAYWEVWKWNSKKCSSRIIPLPSPFRRGITALWWAGM
ncbi:MAG: hypothetical protein IPO22_15385 [Anaerolineales bacterium]|nr:hypothetical protein [Anaerolineales bacterium]